MVDADEVRRLQPREATDVCQGRIRVDIEIAYRLKSSEAGRRLERGQSEDRQVAGDGRESLKYAMRKSLSEFFARHARNSILLSGYMKVINDALINQ